MMPQFAHAAVYRFEGTNFAAGLGIFTLGLFKKVVLADGIAPYADAVFNSADSGLVPSTQEAWIGALAYTFQLYFDFSGYSDMAIGLSWMLNIRLPFNFDSPYKATSIIEFWRRWHISLSTFLRDYLYIALGGNRKGEARRYLNLGLTMLLGGLWHGASWSFVVWGGLHGVYLLLNHAFRAVLEVVGWPGTLDRRRLFAGAGWVLTFTAVTVAWVFFRAVSLDGAMRVLSGMFGFVPPDTDEGLLLWNAGLQPHVAFIWCAVLAGLAWFCPNSNFMGEWLRSRMAGAPRLRLPIGTAALAVSLMLVLINSARDSVSAFIYFNF